MSFSEFKSKIQEQISDMAVGSTRLFTVDVDMNFLWNVYLASFPVDKNLIYRKRREHDCSCCRHFVKQIGNVVALKNGEISTIWDIKTEDPVYQTVANSMSAYIKKKPITNVFLSPIKSIGTNRNFELLLSGELKEWEHFFTYVPSIAVDTSGTIDEQRGELKATKEVFARSLKEITEESITTVLELVAQNSLYRGVEWESALKAFLKYKKEYDKLSNKKEKDLFAWEFSVKAGGVVGRIRNHSMGTLLINISEGMDLELAVKKYECIVAPTNYKRPKAIFTQKMLESAQRTIEELGYMPSLGRRYAALDDITINNVLFSDKDSAKKMSGGNIFEDMAKDVAVNPKKFSRVEEIGISDFISSVLPTVNKMEILLEHRHKENMMSLIAPKEKKSKSMFKWNNGFSWAYTGNIADSMIKENVKSAGGKVDGVLRFSIQWNDTAKHNPNDLDAHCRQPNGRKIFYMNKRDATTGGILDVDIMNPEIGVPAVENITWESKRNLPPGNYLFSVNCYCQRGSKDGFKAEIEFDGEIHSFEYNKPLHTGETIDVAVVEFDGSTFKLKEMLPSSLASTDIWGVKTNQFVPVSVVCYSPNYWDEQEGIGNKHYFFMLKDCVNPENPNGMFNEYLKEELLKHRKVFEALGAKMAVEDSEEQLSGVGFSSTKRDSVYVKVEGATERVLKIKF